MLAEQGAHFTHGFPPPDTNVTHSPMQTWNDSITGSSSSISSVGDNMLLEVQSNIEIHNILVNEGSFAHVHAELWARTTLERAAMNYVTYSNILVENCRFISFNNHMPASMNLWENFTLYIKIEG
jgi:hypothetical protein